MRIGVDMMGGDFAPKATTKGVIAALKDLPSHVKLVLLGNKEQILQHLDGEDVPADRFDFVNTTEVIEMGDHPTKAFQAKQNSSMVVGFHLLKAGEISALASAGNTGALMVGSMLAIKPIPGVIRPCLTSILPMVDGKDGVLLDVGINADCKPDVLYQFGVLGSLLARHVYKTEDPKVKLLNIGEEEKKGNLVAQAAYDLMKDSKDFNFGGNIEARDLFNSKADVVVCDGFTGNIVLKQAEGIFTILKKRNINDPFFDRWNYENYGGTPILGINAPVIKGHGISNAKAIAKMVLLAKDVAEANLSEKIKAAFN